MDNRQKGTIIALPIVLVIGAILALLHDVLITLGVFSLFNREVTLPIVAAFLTIVGYSINDTIVDSDGNPVPHVGIDTYGTCYTGGVALADMAKERGFFEPGNVVKVMSVDVSFKTFLHERTQGYQQGIIDNSPLTMDDFSDRDTYA